jgi:DNA repair exonuclease SbcCD ATPase subunit
MNLSRVQIFGFLSIEKADVDLKGDGVTLVEGINHDSPADSNGAGKSSIFEAVFWCLFGTSRRGLKGDEVINRHVKGGCYVKVEFSTGGTFYYVERSRRYGDMGTAFKLFSHDGELTKGTMKDTQEFLEGVIGVGALTFQKAVYFGQGDVKPFASLTDSELKLVFEQALNLTHLSNDSAMISGYRKGLNTKVTETAAKMDACKIRVKAFTEEKEALEGTIRRFDDRKAEDIKGCKDGLASVQAELTRALADFHTLEGVVEDDKAKAAELKSKIDASKVVLGKIEKQQFAMVKDKAATATKINMSNSTLKEIQDEMDAIIGLKNQPCTVCKRPMDESAVGKAVALLGSRASGIGNSRDVLVLENKIIVDKTVGLESKVKPFKEKVGEITAAYEVAQVRLTSNTASMFGCKSEVELKESQIRILQGDLKKAEAMSNENELFRLEAITGDINAQNAIVVDAESELMGHAFEIDTANVLEQALGNTGIKSLVFDQVTPDLNRYANQYLNVLDPGMNVEVSTVSKIKSGELREKFSINVETATGAKNFLGHSGGEKQKVNLAISMAFNRLMREMSGSVPSLLVLDEPFESLDAGSSEQVMELLATIEAGNIFLVTHNQDVKDLVSNRLTVEKKDGLARVVK